MSGPDDTPRSRGEGSAQPETRDAWAAADRLFQDALDLPAADRTAFLENAGADPEVVDRVRRLLSLEEEMGDFLEEPVAGLTQEILEVAGASGSRPGSLDQPQDRTGERIGTYRLVRLLGRGGMASVWLAERVEGDFEQEAAVKVIRKGLDTDDVVARFRAERRILSALNHPKIGRLLDGGETADGQPYLVMERVDGEPITDYCDRKGLGVRERLRLFVEVAEAVAFAHRSLVVHRDIKPSNILVTTDGHVKLLDFGIAKILDPSAWPDTQSRTGQDGRLLTPDYASPEQIRGDTVTTASDVFQMGVLLYRLLTGRSPFPEIRSSGSSAAQRLVREGGPVSPASSQLRRIDTGDAREVARARGSSVDALARQLKGELDSILLRALSEEPQDRYPSMDAMAQDVRRFLEGRPILAQPPSALYRTRKFLGRHPWVAPVAAAFVVAIIGYVIILNRNASVLREARDEARMEAATAESVTGFLVGLFGLTDPFDGGRIDITADELLDRGAERVLEDPPEDPAVFGRLLVAVGKGYMEMELYDRAVETIEAGLGLSAGERSGHPESEVWARFPLNTRLYLMETLGFSLVQMTENEDGRALLQEAVAIREANEEVPSPERVRDLMTIAESHFLAGEGEQGIAASQAWFPLLSQMEEQADEFMISAIDNLIHFSMVDPKYGDSWELVAEYQERAAELYNDTTPAVAHGYDDLAVLHLRAREFEEALAAATRGYELHSAMFGEVNQNALAALETMGQALIQLDRAEEGEAMLRRVVAGRIEMLGADHMVIPISRYQWSRALRTTGQLDAAEEQMSLAIPPTEAMFGPDNRMTAVMVEELGAIYLAQGRLEEAEAYLGRAAGIYEGTYAPTDRRWMIWRQYMADLRLAQGRVDEAETLLVEGEALLADLEPRQEALHQEMIRKLEEFYEVTGR